jgi:16S rRNA (cytosine1402-N4)-methyltransferase
MSVHKTVLLQETIEGLNLPKNAIVIDGTFGGGGHSKEILKRFPRTLIIALDQDASTAKNKDPKIIFHNENFRNIDQVMEAEGIREVDGIILDLGLSSDQLENSGRGFSFQSEHSTEPLLMTMKENPSSEDVTAEDIVNDWSEESLANIIYGYGQEVQSRRIAKAIVDFRQKKPIKITSDLVAIIKGAIPAKFRKGKIHFATKTFQALRIAVNDELGALKEGLEKGFGALREGGRMSVISFHSLEDRVVKKFYKEKEKEGKAILINKKVITAGAEEIKNNSRSRSAKLRIIQRK